MDIQRSRSRSRSRSPSPERRRRGQLPEQRRRSRSPSPGGDEREDNLDRRPQREDRTMRHNYAFNLSPEGRLILDGIFFELIHLLPEESYDRIHEEFFNLIDTIHFSRANLINDIRILIRIANYTVKTQLLEPIMDDLAEIYALTNRGGDIRVVARRGMASRRRDLIDEYLPVYRRGLSIDNPLFDYIEETIGMPAKSSISAAGELVNLMGEIDKNTVLTRDEIDENKDLMFYMLEELSDENLFAERFINDIKTKDRIERNREAPMEDNELED